MPSFFCINCSTKAKDNTTKGITGDYYLICPDCNIQIRFYITPDTSTKTIEEADASFTATELTPSQKGTWKKKK